MTTRRERRAKRLRGLVTSTEARWASRLARLGYRVPGESGALRLYTHSLTWHLKLRKNGATPPPNRGPDRTALQDQPRRPANKR